MLERFHLFSMGCAVVLASACLGSLLGSLQRSKDGQVYVHQVVLRELPIMVYIWILTAYCVPNERSYLYPVLGIYLSTGALAIYRFLSYVWKNKEYQLRSQLANLQQVVQGIDQIQVQVMSKIEREECMRAKPQLLRRSRYVREPII